VKTVLKGPGADETGLVVNADVASSPARMNLVGRFDFIRLYSEDLTAVLGSPGQHLTPA
jgi:hypothetical protein